MYSRIMVPVDLAHIERLDKALTTAAALAKSHEADIVYVGATPPTPSPVAHSPEEYKQKLKAFVEEESRKRGVNGEPHMIISHDPAVDLGDTLIHAAKDVGADAIVMASHMPGLAEHIFTSNAGYVASHAPISVFVIR